MNSLLRWYSCYLGLLALSVRFQMLFLLLEGYFHELFKELTSEDLLFAVPLTRAVASLATYLECLLVARGPPLSCALLAPSGRSFWAESSRWSTSETVHFTAINHTPDLC